MDKIICGEKGADLGSGRGPWTVHVSFKPDVDSEASPLVVVRDCFDASSSRYADPEAEGVTPVFKTFVKLVINQSSSKNYVHIFLGTFPGRVRDGLSELSSGDLTTYFENTGAEVPPVGPFILLLSAISQSDSKDFKFRIPEVVDAQPCNNFPAARA